MKTAMVQVAGLAEVSRRAVYAFLQFSYKMDSDSHKLLKSLEQRKCT